MSASLVCRQTSIHKCDSAGRLVTTYSGVVRAQDAEHIVVEAEWTRGRCDLGLLVFEDGDCFVETYYFRRWWNVYQVCSPGGELRGWYCNVARPARLVGEDLYFDDLALDILVSASGEVSVCDEDEFAALRLDEREPEAYSQAREALVEIRSLIARGCPPFTALAPGPLH